MPPSHDALRRAGGDRVETPEDLAADLTAGYPRAPGAGARVDRATVEGDLAAVARDGYVLLPELLTPRECAEIRQAVTPLLDRTGRNAFEGHRTQRVYSLLNKTRCCDRLVDHPRVLALLDRLFEPGYLLSQLQVININPGEHAQLLHTDDALYRSPRPRPPLGAATIWAVDPFTHDNGGTVILPGSHRWGDDRRPSGRDPRMTAVMPPGSCLFFVGTLWHGGGANRSGGDRLSLTAQYCQPWLRPQEAFTLSVTRDTARTVSEDIRRMIGYSVHPPFIGMVDGMHPRRLLEARPSASRPAGG
ncbi:phytanoyl-CoA dioxygenase family protein [Streptomyces sp. HNM0645]|uniref:phytanoyl-CoA dioxygenase family protein n=1 Tax=Streptomyces sp. HNM0645 TaxID=2782343 RepID=UPI0024B7FD96|nr:phytanoyl-CoA dioxygenase family protein [Streptomyces sp. HNM0645]MDI9883060.1 phytanoyl-CoA dioxygenase family protein [Streptomyces sp. HNM0645]